MTFSYSTVGMPEAGKKFNNTRVEKKDLSRFDEELNKLITPYNVNNWLFRILIVNSKNGENNSEEMGILLSAKIIFQRHKV